MCIVRFPFRSIFFVVRELLKSPNVLARYAVIMPPTKWALCDLLYQLGVLGFKSMTTLQYAWLLSSMRMLMTRQAQY